MDEIAERIAGEFMANAKEKFQAKGGFGRLIFALTLTEPDEVAAGPRVFEVIERRLREEYPGADIDAKGYGASGYNIQANVNIQR